MRRVCDEYDYEYDNFLATDALESGRYVWTFQRIGCLHNYLQVSFETSVDFIIQDGVTSQYTVILKSPRR